MIERDWSKGLELELVEEPVQQLPLMLRHFSGKPVKTVDDHERLEKSYKRILRIMSDGKWRTVDEIYQLTGIMHTSISAHLRNFRKIGFGSHTVIPRERAHRFYEFQVILNTKDPIAQQLLKEHEDANRKFFYAKHPKPFDITLNPERKTS